MKRALLLIVFSLLAGPIYANPIVIKTGSGAGANKEQAQHQDSNVYDLKKIKGIANYEGEDGFNRGLEEKHVAAQDSGKYGAENSQKDSHLNQNNYAGEQFSQKGGNEVANFDKNNSHKKGHHKSGFSKSYHKDETESNSSYYDDEDDKGGEFVQRSNKNAYGDAAQQNRKGHDYNDKYNAQNQAKGGQYDNSGKYEKDLNNQRDYHSKKYQDENENLGRKNSANQFGAHDQYGEEKYVNRQPHHYIEPHYHQPPAYYNNHRLLDETPQKTITIYEDPRYDDYYPQERYDDYGVQLDIRRPPRDYPDYRYYEKRPSYDYYY